MRSAWGPQLRKSGEVAVRMARWPLGFQTFSVVWSYLPTNNAADATIGITDVKAPSSGFTNLLNWLTSDMQGIWNRRHESMPLDQALVTTAKILSTNPCVLTQLDKNGCGAIVDGAKADLCVLDIAGLPGEYKVTVELTIIDGDTAYSTG